MARLKCLLEVLILPSLLSFFSLIQPYDSLNPSASSNPSTQSGSFEDNIPFSPLSFYTFLAPQRPLRTDWIIYRVHFTHKVQFSSIQFS